ncbi:FAD-dependent oxidoreductase [Xanthomonas nasturtii]|uniref:FAD-dependent oxidoreductase n=1 Tax=Xanthomonas nasturtii TaxID=1843581 RepID=UPI002B2276FE|nr:FAD-dependent oxidoreductase [Xanthomonas nasturtii]MEA9578453.1 FAD-dependent oxidoreductase [Xanthomonas nasturtii]
MTDTSQVLVVGGSIAGLMSALAFARHGYQVTVLERDGVVGGSSLAGDAHLPTPRWWRKGVPHARHTHALAALGRQVLRERAPDIWQALLDAGAVEMPFGATLAPGVAVPRNDDPELFGLSTRRSLIEDVVRAVVLAEPNITLHAATSVHGLLVRTDDSPLVEGVCSSRGELRAALTIDALGRGSAFGKWLRQAGVQTPDTLVDNCGLAYFTRWYRCRQRPNVQLTAGFSVGGYAASSGCIVCPADNGYVSITLMAPHGDNAWNGMVEPAVFTAAACAHAGIAPWLDAAVCEPVSDVLRWPVCENRYRSAVASGMPTVAGTIAVGDALCTTNPTYTRGMSLAMRHAYAVADLAHREGLDDPLRFAIDADALAQRLVRPWYVDSVAQDRTRSALWAGEPPAFQHPDAIGLPHIAAAARHDAVVWHALARRTVMLEDPSAIFNRHDVVTRVRSLAATPAVPSSAAPSRETLLQLIAQHRVTAEPTLVS